MKKENQKSIDKKIMFCAVFTLFLCSFFHHSSLHAQSWVFLPTTHKQSNHEWINSIENELQNKNIQPVSFDQIKNIFRWTDTTAKNTPSLKLLLTKSEKETFLLNSTGKAKEALMSSNFALKAAETQLDALNRDPYISNTIFNLCLNHTWAILETEGNQDAETQWSQCQRLTPHIQTTFDRYPETIRDFFDQQKSKSKKSNLSIKIISKQLGCQVFINGRRFGTTPFEQTGFHPGKYQIRAKCNSGIESQLHTIELQDQDIVLRIDIDFESSTHKMGEDTLVLSYPDQNREIFRRFEDALRIGAILGVNQIVVISESFKKENYLRLDLLEIEKQTISASAVVEKDLLQIKTKTILGEILKALSERESVLFESHSKTYISKWDPPNSKQTPQAEKTLQTNVKKTFNPPTQRTPYDLEVGISLATFGAVGWITSWALWGELLNQNRKFSTMRPSNSNFLTQQKKIDQLEQSALALGLIGSLSLSSNWFFLLPEEEDIPWWAWTAGGAGLVLFGWSLVPFIQNDYQPWMNFECIDPGCFRKTQTQTLGGLTLVYSLPLLSIPATYALRQWVDAETLSFNINPSANGFLAQVSVHADL